MKKILTFPSAIYILLPIIKVVESGGKWYISGVNHNMFYGEYEHSLDNKGRVIIPAKFREILKDHYTEKFYITRGLDHCLFLFTEEIWKSQEKKFREMPFTKAEARRFNRLYFSGACDAVCDKQGRILIPDYLKSYAEIESEVVLIGVSDRIEIWAKKIWETFYKSNKDNFEELAEKLMDHP